MAATIDLNDLIEDVKSEVNPPGTDQFATATPAQWLSQLRNAFWETVIDGLIVGYEVDDDGIVSPTDETSTTPLGRDLQQLIIYYAGIRVLKNALLNTKSMIRAKAGPVEFEQQQAATIQTGLLKEAQMRRDLWIKQLSTRGIVSVRVSDQVLNRFNNDGFGSGYWLR